MPSVYTDLLSIAVSLASSAFTDRIDISHWDKTHISAARFHRITPWLYTALRDRPEITVPREVSEAFRIDYLQSVAAHMARQSAAASVLRALHDAGVPVILLKGSYLQDSVHFDPAVRPMADIDLLVPSTDRDRARTTLESLGYHSDVAERDPFHEIVNPASVYTSSGRPSLQVDLHTGIWALDYYRLQPEIVWRDSAETAAFDRVARFLSPELNFIHLGLHILSHGGLLRDELDMVLLIQRTPFDWTRCTALARSLGVVRPLRLTIDRLRAEWGVTVPGEVDDAFRSYRPSWLERRITHGPIAGLWRLGCRVSGIPTVYGKVRYCSSRLLPGRAQRIALTGSPDWIVFAKLTARRALQLLRRH